MQKTPEILQAERDADNCLTKLIVFKNQVIELLNKHLDKAREYADKKAQVDLLKLLEKENYTKDAHDDCRSIIT